MNSLVLDLLEAKPVLHSTFDEGGGHKAAASKTLGLPLIAVYSPYDYLHNLV